MKRRDLLAAAGGLAAGTLAGCLGGGGGGGTPTATPKPPETPQPPKTPPPPEPVPDDRVSFRMVGGSCGQGENRASVRFEADTVRVDGTIGGRNTCETAQLASVREAGDRLLVRVVAAIPESTGTPACGQCLTDLEYELSVTGTSHVRRVTVVHDSLGEARTVADARRSG